ncbi:MAG: 3'-5' exonuclease [Sulfurovum sp.]|nr:3'-5' exonuclease [Sulfurovum sp.]
MRKVFEGLTTTFYKHNGVLTQEQFSYIVMKHTTLLEESDTIFILLQASGYPIEKKSGFYRLKTFFTPYTEQRYCVIDIETNGSKPGTSQVIEIGAAMIQHGKVIDCYETFVECAYLPEYITKITGIEPEDLKEAPTRREALVALRQFMDDAVFVAHNASFDHTFLSASFERFGLGNIGNPILCTINLAKRTFESERYGLAYLIESLEMETACHHRAYSDALCASKVMLKSFETLPGYVKTTSDLLQFAESSKKTRQNKTKQ